MVKREQPCGVEQCSMENAKTSLALTCGVDPKRKDYTGEHPVIHRHSYTEMDTTSGRVLPRMRSPQVENPVQNYEEWNTHSISETQSKTRTVQDPTGAAETGCSRNGSLFCTPRRKPMEKCVLNFPVHVTRSRIHCTGLSAKGYAW